LFRKWNILSALVMGVLAIVITSLYFDRGLDPFDEGLYATEAWRVLEGKVYGQDFVAPYGPGRYYLIASLFAVFGASLKVQAVLFLFLRGAVAALMALVARRFLPLSGALLLAAAVILAPGALHKSLFQTVVLLNAAAYLFYRAAPSLRSCLAAGFLCGLGALFRVDAGVFGAVSFTTLLALELLWDRPAGEIRTFGLKLGSFLGGALLAAAPVAVVVVLSGDAELVLRAELQRTLNLSRFAQDLSVPGIAEALSSGSLKRALLAVLIPAAPLALLVHAAIVLVSRIRGNLERGSLELLAVAVFGLPVLNQLRITPTFNHLLQAAPLALLAATLVLARLGSGSTGKGRARRARGLAAAGAAALPAAILVIYNLAFTAPDSVLPGSLRNRRAFTSAIPLERAGIFETPPAAANLKNVVAAVEAMSTADDTILTAPYIPVIHFLSRRLPAISFLEPFYYYGSEEFQKMMIFELEKHPPPIAVLGGPVGTVGGQSLSRHAPQLNAYILSRYAFRAAIGPYQIWERKE